MDPEVAHAAGQAGPAAAAAGTAKVWVPGPGPVWTTAQLAVGTGLILVLYLSFFALGLWAIPPTQRRRRSWVLTAVNSTGTSLAGLYYGYCMLRDGLPALFAADPLTTDYGLSIFTVLFFAVYLALDLSLGTLFYVEEITIMSGWVHHTVYLAILYWVLDERISVPFTAFLLSELPTAVMSYGQLDPAWRSDLYFGATYLGTRVLYHGYLLWLFVQTWSPGWSIIIATFVMHVNWFRQWVASSRRKGVLRNLWPDRSRSPPPASTVNPKAA
jgi:hypothetical protein